MSRKNDRKHAFCLVFMLEFQDISESSEMVENYFQSLTEQPEVNRTFVENEFFGVIKYLPEIDAFISSSAEGWDITRLSKVDLAIMRLAVYEMLFAEEIPKKVAINEAVELGKAYSTEVSHNFINGVLGKIALNESKKL